MIVATPQWKKKKKKKKRDDGTLTDRQNERTRTEHAAEISLQHSVGKRSWLVPVRLSPSTSDTVVAAIRDFATPAGHNLRSARLWIRGGRTASTCRRVFAIPRFGT